MHVVVLDVLEGTMLYEGEVHVSNDGTVCVRSSLAGRIISFDESWSTDHEDEETFRYLYATHFVVLTSGVAHPVLSRRSIGTEDADDTNEATTRGALSLLETPTGWVPHRIVIDTYEGWTPMPDLLLQMMRTEFPSAKTNDFASVQMTRLDRPGTTLFALRVARVFSPV